MLKILTVVTKLTKGGTERAAQTFAEGYDKLGHESRVLALSSGERAYELDKKCIYYWIGNLESVIEQVVKWQPDIVHLHSHGLTLDFVLLLKNKLPQAIFCETNVFSNPSPWESILKYSFQLSSWCQWLYIKRGGDKNKSKILSNPVNDDCFKHAEEYSISNFKNKYKLGESIILGRIGQSAESKWSKYLIDIYENLKAQGDDVKLLLVNPPNSIINRAADSIFKTDIIIIDRIIGDESLSVAYSTIDIFVLIAEQGESFGYVSAESMLCNTPVVALNTPWADNSQSEVIGNNVGGLVAHNIKAMQECIELLINDKDLRLSLGRKGKERIINKYNYIKLSQQVVGYLHDDNSTIDLCSGNEVEGYGDVSLLTKLLVKNVESRKLTRFTTGYSGYLQFFVMLKYKFLLNLKVFQS